MFLPRVLFCTLAPMLVLGLLLGGCIMPTRPDAPAAQPPAEPTLAEPKPTAELPAEDLAAVVNRNANVRTGPSTDHAIAYWLAAGDAVTVVGRNEAGDWLQIEHEDRPGWIFAALTDIADGVAEGVAELPAEAPPAEPMPEPAPEPTPEPEPAPTPEAVAPMPEPETAPAAEPEPSPPAVTVTGSVVNLRSGPGTEHATAGQVQQGDALHVTGRNADGSWLQVEDPDNPAQRVWIYGPLTDIDGATVQTLAEVSASAVEVSAAPEPTPEPVAPTPTPVPVQEPAALPPAQPVVSADCTRLHTVNPNETRLQQITDWFGLDLAATAALNGLAPDTPLTAGWQLCLPEAGAAPPTAVEPAPQPAPASQPVAGGPCQTPLGPRPCIPIPDFPERGHPNAPVGQIVVDTGLDILWHAPGSYERDLPGLDYDFELVFTDISTQWDWSVRDFEGCYDALRVHMGSVPKDRGLQRVEYRLADSFTWVEPDGFVAKNWKEFHWRENAIYLSPQSNPGAIPWLEWPNWDPSDVPPELGVAQYGCYLQPDSQARCDIVPWWGNSHSIHLNAAAAQALANIVAYMSDNALARQYRSTLSDRVLEADSYLFPIVDNGKGDPAGHGPCVNLWRAG